MTKKIMCVIGTRPEAIKMAPVIKALKQKENLEVKILATAQHRHLMDQVFDIFDIKPDYDLDLMVANQTLTELTARILLKAGEILDKIKPDTVLVQGDTTTVMAVTLAAFYRQIPVGHIEAGLRTGHIYNPFPEEANRIITGHLARWHFAPTQKSKNNLLRENIDPKHIIVTGNTVIDALLDVSGRNIKPEVSFPQNTKGILITTHRRENFGAPLLGICQAVREIAQKNIDVSFIFPVHPNPNVQKIVYDTLSGIPQVQLCAPLDYLSLVGVLKQAYIVLTDSGGLQEEAPALGKPVLVMRETTERPEAVDAGVAQLIGTDKNNIINAVEKLLHSHNAYREMAQNISPYGDGKAADRIASTLAKNNYLKDFNLS